MPKSEGARLAALSDDTALAGIDESDPKSVGRWMRKMGREFGDDLGGNELEQVVDEIESGGGDEVD